MVSIVPELSDGLRDEHVEPVQRLGLMGVDIIVGLGQNGGSRQAGWGCGSLVSEF